MKSTVTWCLAVVLAATARADTDADTTRAAKVPVEPVRPSAFTHSSTFLRDYYSVPTRSYLTISLNPVGTQTFTPATRLEAVLQGAGTAGTLGMFAGALGGMLGLFDENTAWILTGSLAAAGAFYGGVRYDLQPTLRPEEWSSIPGPARPSR